KKNNSFRGFMDLQIIISFLALILSVLNTIWIFINFLLSKAPILDFVISHLSESHEIKFFLRNIGKIKGILTEISFKDPVSDKEVKLLLEKDQQTLYPQQRSNQDFYLNYEGLCKKYQGESMDLPLEAKISLRILFFQKTYCFKRILSVECKKAS
ncbi:MAG: hypothetical protein ACTSVV_09950, partial [Promethearchaeota archaeon]